MVMSVPSPRRDVRRSRLALAGGLSVVLGLAWRRYTSPFPYGQRWMLDRELPHLGVEDLLRVLAPQAGERLLEIGPGTGLFTLPVARALLPGGVLEIVDIQRQMLDHTLARAEQAGIRNVGATLADARALPFADSSVDGAFLVTTLGEIGDQRAALAELARVVRPCGRVVVGEFLIDWHAVPHILLTARARRSGLEPEVRTGPWWSYLSRLRVAGGERVPASRNHERPR